MTVDDIALTMIKGLGNKGIAYLLEIFGSAEEIFGKNIETLTSIGGLRGDIAEQIAGKTTHRIAEREIKYLKNNDITAVCSTDGLYPSLLRECPDLPHVIYVMGNAEILTSDRLLSMVGTRAMTPYGQRMCDVVVGRMAEIEPNAVIVSGLALGIDGECHRAALRYGLPTVAVIANALPEVTPVHHHSLSREIISKGGAVITELNSQTKQNGAYFVPRNRIIAGVSAGTLVVESPYDGGSLVTAQFAESYNRQVLAIPGRASDKTSYGTNLLIRRRIASMVCSADDIVYELGWNISVPGRIPARKETKPLISEDEKSLLECFAEGESATIDELCDRSTRPISEVSALLIGLELSGHVQSLPGKRYEKI